MTPTSPPTPPSDDREARLTALLLGELSADDADALRLELEQDADLRVLHDRLAQTIGLVREAAGAPDFDPLASPEAPKLSAERHEKLLASFKVATVRSPSKFAQWRRAHGREVAALAAMLMALLLIAAVLTSKPNQASDAQANSRWEAAPLEAFGEMAVPENRFRLFRRSSREPAAATAAGEPPVVAGSGFSAQLWGRSGVSKSGNEERPNLQLRTGGSRENQALAESLSDRQLATPAAGGLGRKIAESELEQSSRSRMADGREPIEGRHRRFAAITLPASDDAVVTSGGVAWEERSGHMAKAGDVSWFDSAPARGTTRNLVTADAGVTGLAIAPATPAIQPVPPPSAPIPVVTSAPTAAFSVADPAANQPAPATRALSESTVGAKNLSDESLATASKTEAAPASALKVMNDLAKAYRNAPTSLGTSLAREENQVPQSGRRPAAAEFTTPSPAQASPVQAAELAQAGKMLFEAGKLDVAEDKFRQALQIDPANPGADYYLSLAEDKKMAAEKNAFEAFVTAEKAYPLAATPRPAEPQRLAKELGGERQPDQSAPVRTQELPKAPDRITVSGVKMEASLASPVPAASPAPIMPAFAPPPAPAPVTAPAVERASLEAKQPTEESLREQTRGSRLAGTTVNRLQRPNQPAAANQIDGQFSGGQVATAETPTAPPAEGIPALAKSTFASQLNSVVNLAASGAGANESQPAKDADGGVYSVDAVGFINIDAKQVTPLPLPENAPSIGAAFRTRTGLTSGAFKVEESEKGADAKPAATPVPAAAAPMDALHTGLQENRLGLRLNVSDTVMPANIMTNSMRDFAPFAGGLGGGGGGRNWLASELLASTDAGQPSAQGQSSRGFHYFNGVESRAKAPADAPSTAPLDGVQARNWNFDADGTRALARSDLQRIGQAGSDEAILSKEKESLAEGEPSVRRVEIALPLGERGEAREKLRVASGPLVVNEVMSQTPDAAGRTEEDFLQLGDRVTAGTAVTGVPAEPARALGVTPAKPAPGRPAVMVGGQADGEKEVKAGAESGKRAAPGTPSELDRLTKELESLNYVRDRLAAKISQDQLEAKLPGEGMMEFNWLLNGDDGVDPSPSLAQRVRGFFGGSVERKAVVPIEKDSVDTEGLGAARAMAGFDPYYAQTQLERIKSKEMLGKVVEKLNLNEAWAEEHGGGQNLKTEAAVKLLQKKLDVRQDGKGSLLDIRAKGDNAEEAARIANAVAQVYKEDRLARSDQRSTNGLRVLQQELTLQNQKIAALQQELERRRRPVPPQQADASAPKPAPDAPIPQPEVAAVDNAFSTFSLNVSDVSFKLAAASLEKGQMPEAASIRTEEFINAFDYRDPEPGGSAPVAFAWERARYPFAHDRDLVRFSVKTAASGRQPGRPLNLVLAIDNSGSMERADRVRILRECLRVLGTQLLPQDRVSVVAFARTARLVADGLPGSQGRELPERAGDLTPQGGTNLEDAMNLAYQAAQRHYLSNGVNRVVLLTDGAANLGDVQPASLKAKVEAHRRQGIALDCFGIGWEGLNDELLEQLSRNGDGRYGFVNTTEAAASEFAGQLAGALKVAASDVKVQVEWNPRRVTSWRQIGYAKHQLKKEQFRDNTVDAAEIGAAEAGNALYTVQVNPAGEGPLGTVRVRFKIPGTSDYREHEWPLRYEGPSRPLEQSSAAIRLAASASAFSEWLVSSPFAAEVTPDRLLGYLRGVPEAWGVDGRPKKLEWMIRQAKSVSGK